MRIRALVSGEVIELNDEGAQQLIDSGIYEPVAPSRTSVTPLTRDDARPVTKKKIR